MGYRLHVAKVHKIEFDCNGFANHMTEQMNMFLYNLASEVTENSWDGYFTPCDSWEYADHIEFEKGVWDKMIENVKKQPQEKEAFSDNEVAYYYSEVLEFMEYVKQHCDQENEWIHLYWF